MEVIKRTLPGQLFQIGTIRGAAMRLRLAPTQFYQVNSWLIHVLNFLEPRTVMRSKQNKMAKGNTFIHISAFSTLHYSMGFQNIGRKFAWGSKHCKKSRVDHVADTTTVLDDKLFPLPSHYIHLDDHAFTHLDDRAFTLYPP